MLAVLVAALLLLLFAGAGAWTLFGQGEEGGRTPGQNAGPGEQGKAAGPQNAEEKPKNGAEDPARGNPGGVGSPDGDRDENQATAPPLSAAEEVVGDLYYQESFRRVDATWALLSTRLQDEIGSPGRWAEREDLYTFTYMEFTALPVARGAGDTAEVTFEVRLDHTWGSESLSGTWVCVNEGGEWKLDRLENARTVPA
jgi:hypothetical protein